MIITRGRVAVGLCTALVASGIALAGGVASAADKNCDDFASQAQAQTYFTSNGGSASRNVNNLDADHDGQACEDYPYSSAGTSPAGSSGTGTPSTGGGSGTNGTGGGTATEAGTPDVDCPDFPDQPAAQAYLERDPADPSGLDEDHDGTACEDHFGQSSGGSTTSTRDDGSTAATSGSQIREVPEGSADTGSW